MNLTVATLAAAGLMSGAAAGAVVGWIRTPLALALAIGIASAGLTALTARGTWAGSHPQAAFFLAAALALPAGLLL